MLDGIEEHLRHQPALETRNKKRLTANELSDWELRVQMFRVFYDVIQSDESQVVMVKAIGHKVHHTLYVGGQEVQL